MTNDAVSTRERVRLAVSEHGPVTAADLGKQLGLTPAAMRRHLDALVAEGVIEEREAPTVGAKKRGRPARAYVLSERGHELLPEGYATLANQVLEHLVAAAGPAALETVARERAIELARSVQPIVDAAGDDPQARAAALASALSGQGFVASARPVAEGTALAGVQLCQGHCPVQHVAQQHPQFCEAEAEAFSDVLGIHVQRLASLAHGDHVCTTFVPTANIRTRAGESTASQPDTPQPETSQQDRPSEPKPSQPIVPVSNGDSPAARGQSEEKR